jgi:sigma-B regulation protein RsbU (phosphoserine phosphatase)
MELVKTLAYFLSGGFLVFLAITITRDNFGNRLNRTCGAMLFFAGLGPAFLAVGSLLSRGATPTGSLEDVALLNLYHLWEFFFPLLLLFSWVFPVDRFREFKHPRLQYLIFIPQIMHLVIMVFFNQISGLFDALRIDSSGEGLARLILKPLTALMYWLFYLLSLVRTEHTAVFGAINLAYVAAAVYFLESGRKYLTNPLLLSQTRLVLWGTRIGLGLFVIAHLAATFLPYEFPETIKSLLMTVGLLTSCWLLIYATIRYQFLDVRLIFRQSFVYTVTSGLLVGAYLIVMLQSRTVLSRVFGDEAETVSYVLIIAMLLFFQPINNWIENLIRSMFIRVRTDHRNILERFSRQVISQFEPRRLRLIIEETLRTALLVERVYFVLYDDEVQEYAVVPSEDVPKRIVIERDDLMLHGINLLDTPTYYHTLKSFKEGSRLAEFLEPRRIKMILPMKDANHLLGFLALTEKAAGYRYSIEDTNLLGVLSNQMVSALTNARLYVDSLERLRLQEEINMARQIQLGLLPAAPPRIAGIDIAVHSTPSRTVGGDFYDFIHLKNGCIGIVIADASGKGMPAALMVAQIQAIVRSQLHSENSIEVMMKNMNQLMAESSSAETYVTLFYGELDTKECRFHYANAGHNYPILVRAGGETDFLKAGGPVIGALPKMEYQSAFVTLGAEDMIFFFTDGLSEAMDPNEVEYGEERVRQFVLSHRDRCTHEIVDGILSDVRSFDATSPPRDDTTIIALKRSNSQDGQHG